MAKTVTADEIREYALVVYVQPAIRRGEKTVAFISSEIHNGMGLKSRFPIVCSSIDADKFLENAAVTLVNREGPKQSSTVRWVFALR
jgi:hypothetical protein